MATSLGALIALGILIPNFSWVILIVMLGWIILFVTSGFVSLSSIICSAAIPFVALFYRLSWEIILFLAVLGGLSLIRHKANIQRLLQKKEHRFNTRAFFKKR
jgi:glycerol-3-phosphate acyltransferase PlsY